MRGLVIDAWMRLGSNFDRQTLILSASDGPIQWPPYWPPFFKIYEKYKKYDFLYFLKIDKNRLFSYIKNDLDRRKLIPIIFYIFWFIQINFLIFSSHPKSYKIIKDPSFSCYLISKNSPPKKVSIFSCF